MSRNTPAMLSLSLAVMVGLLIATPSARAGSETVLHSFNPNNELPAIPVRGVIFDAQGNLYGSAGVGGLNQAGVIYELSPGTSGRWTAKPIYSFDEQTIGNQPEGPLVFDSAGNLYGTTASGGTKDDGVVFRLSQGVSGEWTAKALHAFTGKDGNYPNGPLSIDAAGNVYGTTLFGGVGGKCENGCGTVFEISPGANGAWTETVLHSFLSKEDGASPIGGVVLDAAGNLYGTAQTGGAHSSGIVFQLSLIDGTWTESILHTFCSQANCADGELPASPLTFDSAGNLYGTTGAGGTVANPTCNAGCGTVFELSPGSSDTWTESVLYSFCSLSNCADGAEPGETSLVFDAAGNLYGTTRSGGLHGTTCGIPFGCGTVFELSPGVGGVWSESVLYAFPPNGIHDLNDVSGVVLDPEGNLYGTTEGGGAYSKGTVFKVTP